ncbi:hypothetical protein [Metapseudomonas otitidis]|uniref:hypothetical protein n=1 Tax=Metapseudomonas otitidis TaxID=319939 RepID=UPI002449959B|nr:hypothetical protein [Pseudomonas otitidis]MDG9785233.1 hypothetical protein [Pseudomonas otitidis]
MAEVNKEKLRRLAVAVLSLLDENAAQAARIAELERDKVRLESEAMYGAAGFQAAKEKIAELERECERLRERLEINSQCPYDGIATRDITIEVLEREIDRFKEANRRLSEESVRRRSELEACRKERQTWEKSAFKIAELANVERQDFLTELEALQKDAGYWRYIREHFQLDGDVFSTFNEWFWAAGPLEEVEAAIDAAMQEGGV